jgi:hypothetical protein
MLFRGERITVYCENNPKHINTEKTNNVKLWKCLRSQNIVQHKPYPSIPISPIRGKYKVTEQWFHSIYSYIFGRCLFRISVSTTAVLTEIFRGIAHCSDKCRDNTSIRSRPLPSKSFPIHLPTYIPVAPTWSIVHP